MPISTLPLVPQRNDPATFADRGDSFLAALPVFATELNTLQTEVNATSSTVTTQAAAAALSAAAAASNAAAVVGSLGATIWISGTSYAIGDVRYSPINQVSYRRKTTGAGTLDPSTDSTNWSIISTRPQWTIRTSNTTAVISDSLACDTTAGPFTVTMPLNPVINDTVMFMDYGSSFSPNALIISRNGKNIMGLAEDMLVDTKNAAFTLLYIDALKGWRII